MVLVLSLELSGDDVHKNEVLTPFIGILTEVFVVPHTAAKRTCEFTDDDIDHCPV